MEDTGNICREENIEITFTFESRLNERSKIATLSKSTAHQQTSERKHVNLLIWWNYFSFTVCLYGVVYM